MYSLPTKQIHAHISRYIIRQIILLFVHTTDADLLGYLIRCLLPCLNEATTSLTLHIIGLHICEQPSYQTNTRTYKSVHHQTNTIFVHTTDADRLGYSIRCLLPCLSANRGPPCIGVFPHMPRSIRTRPSETLGKNACSWSSPNRTSLRACSGGHCSGGHELENKDQTQPQCSVGNFTGKHRLHLWILFRNYSKYMNIIII